MRTFDSNALVHTEEDGVVILSLSDDPDDSSCFIIFQKNVCSKQSDIELGLAGCYVESNEIDASGYDVFSNFKIENSKLLLYKNAGDSVPNLVVSIHLLNEELLILKDVMPKLLALHP
jgi:Immunity protein 10